MPSSELRQTTLVNIPFEGTVGEITLVKCELRVVLFKILLTEFLHKSARNYRFSSLWLKCDKAFDAFSDVFYVLKYQYPY